ncbi:MAG TPA: sugar phosphate nucleotidyltransferase [Thermoanaerobaculia bacterium]|nr:sugar phosphate nucleotidyltransferase [Thermoanaerobaculia bacterium]
MTAGSVLILCGGRGRRLGPRSNDMPKVLAPVNGRPILSHVVEQFAGQGFRTFVLATGHLSEKVEDFVRSELEGYAVTVSNAGVDASMLRRIHAAGPLLDRQVIVGYGDTYIELDYRRLLAEHEGSGFPMTLVTGRIRNPFGVVTVDGGGRVTAFVEKPVYDYYIGSFAFRRDLLESIGEDLLERPDGEGLVALFQRLGSQGKLRAFPHEGLQLTFNTEEQLDAASTLLKEYFTMREK